jgi:hypothetical protein
MPEADGEEDREDGRELFERLGTAHGRVKMRWDNCGFTPEHDADRKFRMPNPPVSY